MDICCVSSELKRNTVIDEIRQNESNDNELELMNNKMNDIISMKQIISYRNSTVTDMRFEVVMMTME